MSSNQKAQLIKLCERKLADYVSKRGETIWEHRNRSLKLLSGTLRYEVLKNAKFRCTLCGTPADEKALQVDHILPRKHGGTDEISNLQALCYSCNAEKRHLDATDFRVNAKFYETRHTDCAFCKIPETDILHSNSLAVCILDRFPVTHLHSLIIPKRHGDDYFSLAPAERNACDELLVKRKAEIQAEDRSVMGFNVGTNNGETAGQTILHTHIHLIPRRTSDVRNPRGGIRNIIAGKGPY